MTVKRKVTMIAADNSVLLDVLSAHAECKNKVIMSVNFTVDCKKNVAPSRDSSIGSRATQSITPSTKEALVN